MSPCLRRWTSLCIAFFTSSFLWLHFYGFHSPYADPIDRLIHPGYFHSSFKWKDVPVRHPVTDFKTLPDGPLADIPKVQFDFGPETHEEKTRRELRLAAVKQAFVHSWEGYKKHAWLQDEVAPLSGGYKNGFGGWAATLVDTLDTLWIMGLREEFAISVRELKKVHFDTTPLESVNVFETTIRYLGGLLSAYDLSGHQYDILLEKAVELGEMLYKAFDTPNRMPVTRWDWKNAALGGEQEAGRHSLLAEVGSMTLEFTRLSQLTGDPKWYDAVARVMDVLEEQQERTKLPGLWPVFLNSQNNDFRHDITFSLGGMADSVYEYLPKQHLLLGGRGERYRNMYQKALATAKKHLIFRARHPANIPMLFPTTVKRHSVRNLEVVPEGEHLACFAGGMLALAAKTFDQPEELSTAKQLLEGCLWTYESMASGIGPESFTPVLCKDKEDQDDCLWDDERWLAAIAERANNGGTSRQPVAEQAQQVIAANNLVPGFVAIDDPRYVLRPETIESVFVLYRITGDKTLQERAWRMFTAIESVAKTPIAYASIKDVTDEDPQLEDGMESFWTAETLKYFALVFSEPDVVSLDEYVLNTEAHPLLLPRQ